MLPPAPQTQVVKPELSGAPCPCMPHLAATSCTQCEHHPHRDQHRDQEGRFLGFKNARMGLA